MPDFITKNYFNQRLDGAVATIREDIRGVIQHFNESQNEQNGVLRAHTDTLKAHSDILEQLDIKVTALFEMSAVRAEFENLIRELKAKGIALDERRIFVTKPTAASAS